MGLLSGQELHKVIRVAIIVTVAVTDCVVLLSKNKSRTSDLEVSKAVYAYYLINVYLHPFPLPVVAKAPALATYRTVLIRNCEAYCVNMSEEGDSDENVSK